MVYAEMRLAGARRTKGEDISEDDIPSTSGRQFMEAADGEHSDVPKVDGAYFRSCFDSIGLFYASLHLEFVVYYIILYYILKQHHYIRICGLYYILKQHQC